MDTNVSSTSLNFPNSSCHTRRQKTPQSALLHSKSSFFTLFLHILHDYPRDAHLEMWILEHSERSKLLFTLLAEIEAC